ncbi:MAG TPA: hypothetical protein VHN14_05065 [Kofleriaceae bacterium]|nr:hypothetical protein [Kofleriaceae bacterium]
MHGEAVEDRGGEGSVAEEAAPVAERDVRGDGGGDAGVPPIDEVVEGVSRGRLIATLLDLAEADVVNDQEIRASPGLEAAGVGAIGEAGVEIIEEVEAASVAHGEALFAGTEREGLEEVTLAGAALTGDDEVVVAADEVEAGEFEDERLVEARLEVSVEDLEGLALDKAAGVDAAADALLELMCSLGAEEVLEQDGSAGPLTSGPDEVRVELVERVGQAEEVEVLSEPSGDEIIVVGPSARDSGTGLSLRLVMVRSPE